MAADPLLLAPLDDLALSEETVYALRAKNVLDVLLFRCTADLDKRGVAKTLGADSTVELLQSVQTPPAAAQRYVRVGRALSSVPSVAGYAVDGTLSGEHMDAIVKGLNHIDRRDPDLSESDRNDCVRGLLTEARVSTPAAVSRRAHEMAIALSPPDKEVPDAENDDLNEVSFGTGDDGRTHGTLDLDKTLGEKLSAALRPVAKPVPEPDGSPDPRSTPQRLSEALGKILDVFFAHQDRPTEGGVKPRVTMTVSAEQLLAFQMNGISGAKVPTATFEWTGPVSLPTAQMTVCDSVITKILLDNNAVPLDVGREFRTVTPAIRKALIARDKGCAFPGCGCPAGWTEAHHIKFWSHGGETSLANTVLLCRRHHNYIHHKGWTVFIGGDEAERSSTHVADGHPCFVKPGTTTPMRSHARRTLTNEPLAA
ncbi:HNH endonuclease signature motif containing protein [Williamsia soli]|uniref:HNH endonuclease signature motif containing protein n=1 Tax=Williamsia soli TaxID=364929 RepID=UPI001A9EE9FC|nr:HNH endonuclease signature motif containing protein [Williamsia soli]